MAQEPGHTARNTAIVTGANTGIGQEAARQLCELGWDVVISVRDDAKGKKAVEYIKTAVPTASIDYLTMELSEPDSIREFVRQFRNLHKNLKVLINNAGVFRGFTDKTRYNSRNDNSLEYTMTINCMGPFLLTQLLLEDLQKAATEEEPARIINVSSGITSAYSKAPPFYIDDIMMARPGVFKSGVQAYRNSKLALNLWSNELAKKLQGTNITVNTICPGFVPSTELLRGNDNSWIWKLAQWIADTFVGRKLMKTETVVSAAKKLVNLAAEKQYIGSTGIFFVYMSAADEAQEVINEENQEKIWDICKQYSQLRNEDMLKVLKDERVQ